MEMGLDSLASTELVRDLSARFELQLPATLLFNYPTVITLSKYLHGEICLIMKGEDDDSELSDSSETFGEVTVGKEAKTKDDTTFLWADLLFSSIRSGVSTLFCAKKSSQFGPSLVFVHGAMGTAVGKAVLPVLESSVSCFFFQAPDLNRVLSFDSIEDRAKMYFQELKDEEVLMHGIHFVGYSYGALLVYQLASLCQAEGISFTVTLIDPMPLADIDEGNQIARNQLSRRAEMYKTIFASQNARINGGLSDLVRRVDDGEIPDSCEVDTAVMQLTGADKDTMDIFGRVSRVAVILGLEIEPMMKARASRSPKPQLNCPCVSIFKLESGFQWFKDMLPFMLEPKDGVYGWSSTFPGGIEVFAAKGTHMEFWFHPTNVKQLARQLDVVIERGFGDHGNQVIQQRSPLSF